MSKMRKIIYLYLVLLGTQYLLNPFVPTPRYSSERTPATVYDSAVVFGEHTLVRLDGAGLIVQADGDGGDTAQRTGMFFYVQRDPEGFRHALDLLEVSPGIYVRHPHQAGFRSDPRRFSRDQQRPLIIALGKYGMRERLGRMAWEQFRRMGKYQNLDFIGPIGVGEYIRAFDAKLLYPVLLATDASLLMGSLSLALMSSLDPDDVDDNNHVMTLLQAQDTMPTPLGWLAIKAYQEFRPRNYGNFVLGKENAVQGALAWYHRIENGGNPYIGEAVFEALEKN